MPPCLQVPSLSPLHSVLLRQLAGRCAVSGHCHCPVLTLLTLADPGSPQYRSLYNISVEENDEASVLYNFLPDARLDPATLQWMRQAAWI